MTIDPKALIFKLVTDDRPARQENRRARREAEKARRRDDSFATGLSSGAQVPSLVRHLTHRDAIELKRGAHVAQNRFNVGAITGDTLDVADLTSPRPVDYLAVLRCTPVEGDAGQSRPITAQDHLVLETLICASRDYHASHEKRIVEVPVASVLAILGEKVNRGGLIKSLDRLVSTTFTLPALKIPRERMGFRKAEVEELGRLRTRPKYVNWSTGPFGRWASEVLDPHLDDDYDKPRPAAVEPSPPVWERPSREIPTRENYKRLREEAAAARPEAFTTAEWELHTQGHPDVESWRDDKGARDHTFTPIVRWTIHEGILAFELASLLRFYLNSFRKVDQSRVPYAYLDLRDLRAFRSPYTAPLYRYLLANSFDPVLRRPTFGKKVLELTYPQLAEIVGYRVQAGGLRSQLERNVVSKIETDLARLSGSTIKASVGERTASAVAFGIQIPFDLKRIGTRRIFDDRGKPLTKESFQTLSPGDVVGLHVPARTWLKIRAYWRIDKQGIFLMARAWRRAVDEALHAGDPSYGYLSEGLLDASRMRGPRILEMIEQGRVEEAAFLFAGDEVRSPDLTHPEKFDRLDLDGTEKYMEKDRVARIIAAREDHPKAPKRAKRPGRVTPVPQLDLLARERELSRRDEEQAKAEALARRLASNARRREENRRRQAELKEIEAYREAVRDQLASGVPPVVEDESTEDVVGDEIGEVVPEIVALEPELEETLEQRTARENRERQQALYDAEPQRYRPDGTPIPKLPVFLR